MISGIVIRLIGASGRAGNVPGAIGICLASDAGQGRGAEPPEALFVLENGRTVRLNWREFHADAAIVGFLDEICGLFTSEHLASMPPEALRDAFGSYFLRDWPATPRRHFSVFLSKSH